MDHRAFRELAAGAALDDLEPTESATLAGHLATCAACRLDSTALADELPAAATNSAKSSMPSSMSA